MLETFGLSRRFIFGSNQWGALPACRKMHQIRIVKTDFTVRLPIYFIQMYAKVSQDFLFAPFPAKKNNIKVEIFCEGHSGKFFQILWPSQNIWTLTKIFLPDYEISLCMTFLVLFKEKLNTDWLYNKGKNDVATRKWVEKWNQCNGLKSFTKKHSKGY